MLHALQQSLGTLGALDGPITDWEARSATTAMQLHSKLGLKSLQSAFEVSASLVEGSPSCCNQAHPQTAQHKVVTGV